MAVSEQDMRTPNIRMATWCSRRWIRPTRTRDTGMAGLGYVPASQGGTHIVERNLTRLTVIVGTIFFVNTVILYHLLK